MSAKRTYYVMHCVDGDECLLANKPTLEAAVSTLLTEHKRDDRADLSVWTSDGVILLPSVYHAKRFAAGELAL